VADALAALERRRPDVLVSDLAMPEEDGFVLIRRLRALPAERGGRVPAIALTALAGAETSVRALIEGFDTHVAKPVEPLELVAAVARLAGRARR
jgi:CheY-like chemotaxis protein